MSHLIKLNKNREVKRIIESKDNMTCLIHFEVHSLLLFYY